MNYVMQAKTADRCAVCGHMITPGTVFITKRITYVGGQVCWIAVHLQCNAMLRGAKADRLRELAAPTPAGKPIGDGIMLPVLPARKKKGEADGA